MAISQNFIDAIKPLFSNEAELQEFLDAAPKPLNKSIKLINSRVNPGGSYDDLKGTFLDLMPKDRTLTPTVFQELKDQRYIDREVREIALGKTIAHLCGFFYMQEVAASLPANFLDIPEDGIVLDVCAAPGGKTVQLADRLLSMNAQKPGLVVGNDVDRKRLQTRGTNINRTGMYNTVSTQLDGSAFGNLLPEFFDAVLVDAPCSGEGTSFKSDYALKRRKEESINKIAATQMHILTAAIKTTKIGGSIIFSTCTLNHIENERNVKAILEKYGDQLELQDVQLVAKSPALTHYQDEELLSDKQSQQCVRCWPHKHHTGGFFVSKFRKIASVTSGSYDKVNRAHKKDRGKPYMSYETSKKLTKDVTSYISEKFGIQIDPLSYDFASSSEKIYLISPKAKELLNVIPLTKIGVPILKKTRDAFRPLHGLGLVLGHLATKNIVHLDDDQLQEYSLMRDIPFEGVSTTEMEDGNTYVILQRKNYGVSVSKRVNSTLKNKFIKRGSG